MSQPSTIYKPGKLNYVWNYLGKTLKDFATALFPYLLGGSVDANGNSVTNNTSNNTVAIPTGVAAVDFVQTIPNFSGVLVVNDHNDGGVEMWVCGGGDCTLVSSTTASLGGGSMAQNGFGYDWTNDQALNGPFTFTVIKTRNEA